jgi:hypothetical protein
MPPIATAEEIAEVWKTQAPMELIPTREWFDPHGIGYLAHIGSEHDHRLKREWRRNHIGRRNRQFYMPVWQLVAEGIAIGIKIGIEIAERRRPAGLPEPPHALAEEAT